MTIHDMRNCWIKGVIDEHTIVFADGYEEWAPVNKVQELQWCIKTPEVRIMSFVERMRQRAQGLAACRIGNGPGPGGKLYSMSLQRTGEFAKFVGVVSPGAHPTHTSKGESRLWAMAEVG